MISLYFPGDSLLHRAPAWIKLLGLAILSVAMFMVPVSYWAAAAFLIIPVVLYLMAQLPLRIMVVDLGRLVPLLIFMVITQLIFLDLVHAAANTARLIGLILAAQVLTRTTTVDAMVNVVERLLHPIRNWPGVNPQKLGLALGLLFNSVGTLVAVIRQVRDAQKSRGVRIAPWAWVIPVLVLTLQHADNVGDALVARGLEE